MPFLHVKIVSLYWLTSQLSLTITDYHAHKSFKSHAKSSHDKLSVAIFHREHSHCHLNTQTLSNTEICSVSNCSYTSIAYAPTVA
jgi:hypothetical protein